MKYQQGLLLEGTRVLFSLSHQHSINGAVRSWCCLPALQGWERVQEKGGDLSEGPDSPGVSVAPCEQGEPERRGPGTVFVRNTTASTVWGAPASSCIIIQVLPVSPKLLSVPGGLQGQLLWQTLAVPLMQLWEIWVGAGFCQRDVFIRWQCSWLELQSQPGLPEGSLAWPGFSCL